MSEYETDAMALLSSGAGDDDPAGQQRSCERTHPPRSRTVRCQLRSKLRRRRWRLGQRPGRNDPGKLRRQWRRLGKQPRVLNQDTTITAPRRGARSGGKHGLGPDRPAEQWPERDDDRVGGHSRVGRGRVGGHGRVRRATVRGAQRPSMNRNHPPLRRQWSCPLGRPALDDCRHGCRRSEGGRQGTPLERLKAQRAAAVGPIVRRTRRGGKPVKNAHEIDP